MSISSGSPELGIHQSIIKIKSPSMVPKKSISIRSMTESKPGIKILASPQRIKRSISLTINMKLHKMADNINLRILKTPKVSSVAVNGSQSQQRRGRNNSEMQPDIGFVALQFLFPFVLSLIILGLNLADGYGYYIKSLILISSSTLFNLPCIVDVSIHSTNSSSLTSNRTNVNNREMSGFNRSNNSSLMINYSPRKTRSLRRQVRSGSLHYSLDITELFYAFTFRRKKEAMTTTVSNACSATICSHPKASGRKDRIFFLSRY